jgi:hypothetical protein
MSYVLPILFVLGVYVAFPAVLAAGWVRWVRRRQIGRTWPSLTGFSLGTASALLAIGSMVYAGSGAAQSRRWPLAVIGATGNQWVTGRYPKPEEKDDASHRVKG